MEENVLNEEIEVLEDEATEEIEEASQETVSMGDSDTSAVSDVVTPSLTVEDITLAVSEASLTAEEITAAIEAAQIEALVTVSPGDSLWTKPLEDYTVTEGLLLILVLCAVGLVIQKIIGGILNCKSLLKRS